MSWQHLQICDDLLELFTFSVALSCLKIKARRQPLCIFYDTIKYMGKVQRLFHLRATHLRTLLPYRIVIDSLNKLHLTVRRLG